MTRPNRPLYATGTEMTVADDKVSYVFRQVGWIGQSGDFYSLDEDPSPTEPGSFDPLWFIAHDDRIEEVWPDGEPVIHATALDPSDF